ncbi:MAG: thiolase family protein, partial [Deltaproteobacteria bacterium]|nr:thiolase family protein [Deltaproteobacteria bacterium]
MREAVIVSAVRTPVGKANRGAYRDVRPEDLGKAAIQGALAKVPALNPADVDDVIIGCAMPEGQQGLNMARIISVYAGLPVSVPAETVNRFCSSGLQTIAHAAERIMAGQADVIIAGGVESMSAVPMSGHKPSPHPGIVSEHPEIYTAMGNTAEIVATRYGIDRARQDAFAARSHERAIKAIAEGKFKDEIIPYGALTDDEGPRPTTAEGLGGLKPAFSPKGSVTAGNSSQVSDGAAISIVMSREKAEALGLEILAIFRGYAVAGCNPDEMGIGPVFAIPKVLQRAGVKLEEIDLIELNEAFASQSLYIVEKLGLDDTKVNVNGGAIALGHPLGCTGAKLTAS